MLKVLLWNLAHRPELSLIAPARGRTAGTRLDERLETLLCSSSRR